jgi:iron complex outermembrane receptor protein
VKYRASAIFLLFILAIATHTDTACADETDRTRYRVNLPSLELDEAAERLQNQTGIKLSYPVAIGRRRMPAVRGRMNAVEALIALLSPSGLGYRVIGSRAFDIFCPQTSCPSGPPSRPERSPVTIPEVFVVGHWVQNGDIPRKPDDPLPAMVVDRIAIERHGGTLPQILQDLIPANTGWSAGTPPGGIRGGPPLLNLRGLGGSQTIIMIDGRRVTGLFAAGEVLQPDLEVLPAQAIERIEVLPSTTSGIYGGGATGGVVNIVLRHDVTQSRIVGEVDHAMGEARGGRRLFANVGKQWSRFDLALSASFSEESPPRANERDALVDGRKRILEHDPAYFAGLARPPLGDRINFRSVDGSSLYGPGTPHFGTMPAGMQGPATVDALRPGAGTYSFSPAPTAQAIGGEDYGTVPRTEIASIDASLRATLTPAITADFQYAWARAERWLSDSAFPAFSFTDVVLDKKHDNNPFGTDLYVALPLTLGNSDVHTIIDTRRMTALVKWQPGSWSAVAEYTRSDANLTATRPDFAGTLDLSKLNPFGDPLLDVGLNSSASTLRASNLRAKATDVALRVAGPWRWGNDLTANLTFLAEQRGEVLSDGNSFLYSDAWARQSSALLSELPEREQLIRSAYAEVRVPIRRARTELQFSVRHDRYTAESVSTELAPGALAAGAPWASVQFSETMPLLAFKWTPINWLGVRGSLRYGYAPPSLAQISPPTPIDLPAGAFSDPRRGGAATPALQMLQGGDPTLTSERSESWSAGFILTPALLEGFRLSADWTRVSKKREVQSTADILSQRGLGAFEKIFPKRVRREPSGGGLGEEVGAIAFIDGTPANIAKTVVDVWDVSLSQHVPLAHGGAVNVSLLGSYLSRFARQPTPDERLEDLVGLGAENPGRWRISGTLSWHYDRYVASWSTRAVSHYTAGQDLTPGQGQGRGSHPVKDQFRHDAMLHVGLGSSSMGDYSSYLDVGVRNVFDAAPAFDATLPLNNYASPLVPLDPRTYFIRITKAFP